MALHGDDQSCASTADLDLSNAFSWRRRQLKERERLYTAMHRQCVSSEGGPRKTIRLLCYGIPRNAIHVYELENAPKQIHIPLLCRMNQSSMPFNVPSRAVKHSQVPSTLEAREHQRDRRRPWTDRLINSTCLPDTQNRQASSQAAPWHRPASGSL
jgi:hypothetical protein